MTLAESPTELTYNEYADLENVAAKTPPGVSPDPNGRHELKTSSSDRVWTSLWTISAALFGAFAVALILVLPKSPTELSWFLPAVDILLFVLFGLTAVLGCMDAILRRHGRSIPTAAAAAGAGLAWIAHLITFPGVLPSDLPHVGPQTAAMLFHLAHIGTPTALAIVLLARRGPLRRPGRTVTRVLAGSASITLLLIATAGLLAPVVPALVVDGRFTALNRALTYAALIPIATAAVVFVRGRRGDERVSGSVAAALVLFAFETVGEMFVPARFEPGWYITLVLRLSPAFVLVLGQLNLYARTVSERVRTEETIRRAEARTRAVIAAASESFVEIDSSGLIVSWNEKAEEMFGYTTAEIIGRTLAQTIVPPEFREAHERGLKSFLGSGRSTVLGGAPIQLTALRRDGSVFPVELSVWPVQSDLRVTFCAFVRDITERKKAEVGLSQLAAVVEHSSDAVVTLDRKA